MELRTKNVPEVLTSTCLIHCSDAADNFTTLSSEQSWNTLKHAAGIRRFEPIIQLSNETEIPVIIYHRKCYQTFTMKCLLDRLERKSKELDKEKVDNDSKLEQLLEDSVFEEECHVKRKPSADNLLPDECLFCMKKGKYKNKKLEKLTLCCESRAAKAILDAAEKKNDFRVMGLVSYDVIASEGKYHNSCYTEYTRV